MVAHVQTVSVSGNNVTSVTTPAITTAAGNLLVATGVWRDGEGTTFSDSAGQSWTTGVGPQGSNGAQAVQRFVASNTGSASHTFTCTWDTTGFPTISVTEISGATASPKDVGAISATGTGTSHSTPGITTTFSDVILVAFAEVYDHNTTYAGADGSFTVRTNIATSATSAGLITATKVVSGTGTYDWDYTTSTSITNTGVEGIVAYKSSTTGVSGSIAVTEGADTLAASGALGIGGTIAVTEAADTLSAGGSVGTPPATSPGLYTGTLFGIGR